MGPLKTCTARRVISPTSGAWQTDALLLSLIPDGNDTIVVGSGNDVIIGQGGNNTITANGGNDIIFGNAASNTSPVASDIPWIVNAVVIAASNIAQISLPAGGQATPMTYMWKGRQYVVIAAGGHSKLDTTRGDQVVAFALPH